MTLKVKIQKTETTNGYDVLIGKGLIGRIGDIIKDNIDAQCKGKTFLIIIGQNSAIYYLEKIEILKGNPLIYDIFKKGLSLKITIEKFNNLLKNNLIKIKNMN